MQKHKHPSLYPDILFHFTSKEGLFKILEHTFNINEIYQMSDIID